MHSRASQLILVTGLSLAAFLTRAAPERYWERLPDSPALASGIRSVALDGNDGFWALTHTGIYFWNVGGKAWELAGPHFSRGGAESQNYGHFLRTLDRLYLLFGVAGAKASPTQVYELKDGKAKLLTEFQFMSGQPYRGLWGCQDGRLLNWSEAKLRIFADGAWQEWDAELDNLGPVVLDRGETVFVYSGGILYAIDGQDNLTKTKLGERDGNRANGGALWGKDQAIVFLKGDKKVRAFRVSTGEPVALEHVNVALAGRTVHDALPMPNGAVWLLTKRRGDRAVAPFELSPDGEIREVKAVTGFLDVHTPRMSDHTAVNTDRWGNMWFSRRGLGISFYKDGELRQFDPQLEVAPRPVAGFVINRAGVVFVAAGSGLYAYKTGVPMGERPQRKPSKLHGLGEEVWKAEMPAGSRVDSRWRLGEMILMRTFLQQRGNGIGKLIALDSATGRERFSLLFPKGDDPKEEDDRWYCQWYPGHTEDEFLAVLNDHILVLDARTGETRRTIPVGIPPDSRDTGDVLKGWIEVFAIDGDRYLLTSRQSSTVRCVDAKGQRVWDLDLPRSDMGWRLVTKSGLFLAYSFEREPSWGHLLRAVEAQTGTLVWESKSRDACLPPFVVGEEENMLSVGLTRTAAGTTLKLVCRDVLTREAQWTYQRAGRALSGNPTIGPRGERIYLGFGDGAFVSIDSKTGKGVWEVQPNIPSLASRSWKALQSAPGALLLMEGNAILTVLSQETGRELARFRLGDMATQKGQFAGYRELSGPPWMVGETLIVPKMTGLYAYRFPAAAYQSPERGPKVEWAQALPAQTYRTEIALAVTATGGEGKLTVKYQCDGGKWRMAPLTTQKKHTVTFLGLTHGRHTLRVGVFDSQGRSSSELVHRLQVTLGYEQQVRQLLPQLASEQAWERDLAKSKLLGMGPASVPYLKKHHSYRDPAVGRQVAQILKVLTAKGK